MVRALAAVGALAVMPAVASAETDGREYEPMATLPGGTISSLNYFRQHATSDSRDYSETLALFRISILARWRDVAFYPIDLRLPVRDATRYADDPLAGGRLLHASGLGDATYRPTLAWVSPKGDGSDWVTAVSVYVTAPTGNYDEGKLLSVGKNRWSVKPEFAFGYRVLSFLTVDAVANAAFHSQNQKFVAALDGLGNPVTRVLGQGPTVGAEGHLTLDLTPTFSSGLSYYVTHIDAGNVKGGPPQPASALGEHTVQAVRLTLGIRIESGTLLLLQLNSDVSASGGAPISRFFGARIGHDFF